MKPLKIILLALITISLGFVSCKNKTSDKATTTENNTESATATPKGKYAIKSGIVEYKTNMMGMDMKQVLTFDNYGKEEVTEMIAEMMGVKIHTITLT